MGRVTSTRQGEYLGISGNTLGEGVHNPTEDDIYNPRGEGFCSPTGEGVGGVRGDIALIQSKLQERLAEGRDRSSRLGREVSGRADILTFTASNQVKERDKAAAEKMRLEHRVQYLEEQAAELQGAFTQVPEI